MYFAPASAAASACSVVRTVPRAEDELGAFLGENLYRLRSRVGAERHFRDGDAARDERLTERQRLFGRVELDDGYEAYAAELFENFVHRPVSLSLHAARTVAAREREDVADRNSVVVAENRVLQRRSRRRELDRRLRRLEVVEPQMRPEPKESPPPMRSTMSRISYFLLV